MRGRAITVAIPPSA